ncbi:MAG: D-arabinose 5-phosphate isomerase [Flavobacteriales bacterium]|nr:D-arabinose 5-phosphate isomerase [Flavobacteriales bacterium]|tara:strand:- start:92877 stop:93842 length:966 start_codon:yes stop_codon:yes gene_type:complete
MKTPEDIKKIAVKTIEEQLAAINKIKTSINSDFVNAINLILNSKGRLIVAGIGKSANIANKMVATFNSTGQPSVFLHAADAIHGDLGNIQNGDIVICISKSGNTSEVKTLIPFIKNMGNQIIALTGNTNSFLAKESDIVLDVSVEKEACPNNLAPTTSTTAQLIMGDAIAISLLELKNFSKNDFARFHPGGSLGKRLNLFLNDILEKDNIPKVDELSKINDVIIEISHKRLGATAVMKNNKLCGIITDGDLRRMLEKYDDFSLLKAKDIMTSSPITISSNRLAYDALQVMEDNNINQIILLKEDNYIGIVHIHEILRQGVI